jgi:hypothetical protein
MIAADRAVDAAFQRLSGDSTFSVLVGGRISREPIVPVGTGLPRFPYTTVGIQANPPPLTTLDATIVKERPVIRVSAWVTMGVGQGHALRRQIGDRIVTLLHGYRTIVGTVTIGKFVWIGHTDLTEEEVDGTYLHRVLLFRVEAHQ